MIRYASGALVLFTVTGFFAPAGNAQVATDGFSVVLERVGSKWSMECTKGCPLKSASTTVENPATPMRLDSQGVRTAVADHPSDVKFSIGLTPRGKGWVAVGNRGTLWTELSLDCPYSSCRAVVTESGVSLEPSRR